MPCGSRVRARASPVPASYRYEAGLRRPTIFDVGGVLTGGRTAAGAFSAQSDSTGVNLEQELSQGPGAEEVRATYSRDPRVRKHYAWVSLCKLAEGKKNRGQAALWEEQVSIRGPKAVVCTGTRGQLHDALKARMILVG